MAKQATENSPFDKQKNLTKLVRHDIIDTSNLRKSLKMPDTNTTNEPETIFISDNAAKRIATLVEMEEKDGMRLRVSVSGGGCSGFQYGFSLDAEQNDDDLLFEKNGIEVVVDQTSLDFLKGSQVDFVEDLIGSYFSMNNPNATSTCGCGTSFAV
jgi:iron-sulfur cluster insertion protein